MGDDDQEGNVVKNLVDLSISLMQHIPNNPNVRLVPPMTH